MGRVVHSPPSAFQVEPPPNRVLTESSATFHSANMITDNQLYTLAIFLGSASMLLIILYHFLEVNSEDHVPPQKPGKTAAGKVKS
ncbi:hypothetical protein BS50DRAFT_628875 [Corynespora cassiicola Philippines]|uniref:Dolichyl-diphosphooligosaccharide--protein glycosyltransferase subunit 4 n=1 Tax=Corynespora cassiicola Philippines TaxID=1448308 RepID=A0A2T2P4Y6_CORCC|nr:hypothetical protein BS50DRAFT_628875 [Corynespora cassiicola Philippines]